MIGNIVSETIDNQVIDMTDWDLSETETIRKAIKTVENRQGRAIILSAAMGTTKFNRMQCSAVDPKRLMRAPLSHVNKVIKCVQEQANRGLYFARELISGKGDERDAAIQRLTNQKGKFESNEYYVMYRDGEFGWIITKAKVLTNGVAVRDSISQTIAGRCWVKNPDNKRTTWCPKGFGRRGK